MIYLADRTVSEASVTRTAPGLCRVYISPHGPVHSGEGRSGQAFCVTSIQVFFCVDFEEYIYCLIMQNQININILFKVYIEATVCA